MINFEEEMKASEEYLAIDKVLGHLTGWTEFDDICFDLKNAQGIMLDENSAYAKDFIDELKDSQSSEQAAREIIR